MNESGIQLQERRPSRDLLPRIRRAGDATDADERHLPSGLAMQIADDLRAARAERTSAQPPVLGINLFEPQVAGVWARGGRVGGDQASELARTDEFENLIERFKSKIRRNFHQDGLELRSLGSPCLLRMYLLERGENFIERGPVLELPEIRCVRRTDINYEEVSVRPEHVEGIGVIVRRFFERGDLGLAEINADRMVRPANLFAPSGESLGQRERRHC